MLPHSLQFNLHRDTVPNLALSKQNYTYLKVSGWICCAGLAYFRNVDWIIKNAVEPPPTPSACPSVHPSLTPSSILRQLFEKVSVHQKLINFILISLVFFLTQPMMLFLFVFYTFQCCYCSARCVCDCSFISVSVSRNITQQTLRGMRHLLVPACLIACQIIVIIDERVVVIFAIIITFIC